MFESYQQFVLQKEAPPPKLSPTSIRLVHVALGIATETMELSLSNTRTNTEEELGDLCWYFFLAFDVLYIDLTSLPTEGTYDIHQNELPNRVFERQVENFVSCCKKALIYQQDILVEEELLATWVAFLSLVRACNLSLEYLLASNQEKLEKRYKEKFTKEESIQRNDKEEEEE